MQKAIFFLSLFSFLYLESQQGAVAPEQPTRLFRTFAVRGTQDLVDTRPFMDAYRHTLQDGSLDRLRSGNLSRGLHRAVVNIYNQLHNNPGLHRAGIRDVIASHPMTTQDFIIFGLDPRLAGLQREFSALLSRIDVDR